MHVGCGYRGALKLQVHRCAGIVHHGHGVAQVGSGTAGRLDAHVAHRTNDHQLLDALCVQQLLEVGVAEGIGIVLEDDGLAFNRCHGGDDLHAITAGYEDRCTRLRHLVPDMDDQLALGTCRRDDAGGVGQGSVDAYQRQFAGGKVLVLKINNDDGALVHGRVSFFQGLGNLGAWFGVINNPPVARRARHQKA